MAVAPCLARLANCCALACGAIVFELLLRGVTTLAGDPGLLVRALRTRHQRMTLRASPTALVVNGHNRYQTAGWRRARSHTHTSLPSPAGVWRCLLLRSHCLVACSLCSQALRGGAQPPAPVLTSHLRRPLVWWNVMWYAPAPNQRPTHGAQHTHHSTCRPGAVHTLRTHPRTQPPPPRLLVW